MCGILGSINTEINNSILNEIQHRGPDDCGMENFDINNYRVQFLQRRLSIVDLSPAGHQPMNTECNNYSIIFNGEIYNHLALRERLKTTTNFKGHSDTETILYYLKEFGIQGFKDMNGIFAIAFLDKVNYKLYLARDPFGVKPLYYRQYDNNLIFSSEIRPLKALSQKLTLNHESLASLLRLRFNPAPDTLYKEIKKVQPGHCLQIGLQDRNLVIKNLLFADHIPQTFIRSTRTAVKEYGNKLESSVRRQLMSDVEIGILLSGGIDSALVAGIAQKHYKGKLKAFTVGFEGSHWEDEISDAAETAKILGINHYYKKIGFIDFLNTIKECTRIVEEPLATTSMIPMYYLSELASQHVKVVLSGQGADEPLGGYVRYRSEILRAKIPELFRRQLHSLAQRTIIHNENISRALKSIGIENEIDRFLIIYEVFNALEIKKLISLHDSKSSRRISYLYDILNCISQKTPVERMMSIDSRFDLADDLLCYTDKISMHFSLECRVPMLDLELVKFIESLPLHYKLNLRGGKIIHKQFARHILPARIINRKKKSFQSPTKKWFIEHADTLKDLLLTTGTNFSKTLNTTYVAEVLRQHQEGYNREKQIFLLLSIYYWLENLNNPAPAHGPTPLLSNFSS